MEGKSLHMANFAGGLLRIFLAYTQFTFRRHHHPNAVKLSKNNVEIINLPKILDVFKYFGSTKTMTMTTLVYNKFDQSFYILKNKVYTMFTLKVYIKFSLLSVCLHRV